MKTTRQYLLAALLYVREKPKTHVYRTKRGYVNKLLKHYIAQWKTGRRNPLRHELLNWLIERVEEDEKNGTELGSNYSPQAAVD